MIINLQGIGIWILIAVLKHMTGAQPGLSGTQIMHHFMIALWEKWKRIREYTEGTARVKTHKGTKIKRWVEMRKNFFLEVRSKWGIYIVQDIWG